MTSRYFDGSTFGGAVAKYTLLEKYGESALAAEKAKLVRNIAEDIHKSLNTKIDSSRPLGELISSMKKIIPEPGKTGIKNPAHQKVVCLELAKAINRRFPRAVIDTEASTEEVCESVATTMAALFTGVRDEFLPIANDVQRTLSNMQILRNSLIAAAAKLEEIVAETEDSGATIRSQATMTLYKDLIREFDRQMAVLAGLVNVTLDPTSKTIAELSVNDDAFRGFVKSLKGQMGSTDLTNKISYMLAGLNNVAITADVVDRALRAIGATVSDYKSAHNTDELVTRMYDIFERQHKQPNADEVAKFIAALDIIRKNDYAHNDIVRVLEERRKGVAPRPKPKGKSKGRGKRGGATGGADPSRKSLETRIERQNKTRAILFADFERRLETHYTNIMNAVRTLEKRLSARSIPITDDMRQFIRIYRDFAENSGWEREGFHLALTGYRTDPVSRDERASFLGKLDAIGKATVPLSTGQNADAFKAVKHAVDALREEIDGFADKFLRPATKIAAEEPVIALETKVVGAASGGSVPFLPEVSINGLALAEAAPSADGGASKGKRADNVHAKAKHETKADASHEAKVDVSAMSAAAPVEASTAAMPAAAAAAAATPAAQDAEAPAAGGADSDGEDASDNDDVAGGAAGGDADAVVDPATLTESDLAAIKDGGYGEATGAYATLRQSATRLSRAFTAAQIGENLKKLSGEIREYGKDYSVILGDAMGDLAVRAKKEGDDIRTKYTKDSEPEGKLLKQWVADAGTMAVPNDPLTGQPAFASQALHKEWRQGVVDSYLALVKAQTEAKVEMIKTAEAVDLYLNGFSSEIAAGMFNAREFSELLESAKMAGKWFNDNSGDTLAQLFESFPADMHEASPIMRGSDDSFRAGSDGGHYYEWIGQQLREAAKLARQPSNPFLGVLPGRMPGEDESVVERILANAQKAASSVRALDNIISAFTKMGQKLGAAKAADKTFMSAGMIFKNLRNYIINSAISVGWAYNDATELKYTPGGVAQNILTSEVGTAAAIPGGGRADRMSRRQGEPLRTGIAMGAGLLIPAAGAIAVAHIPTAAEADNDAKRTAWVRQKFSVAMTSIPYAANDERQIGGFAGGWTNTDKLFIMVIKAIMAKIFTVIGAYSLHNRPVDKVSSMTAVRMILGGAAERDPEIIDEAVELYIRVPLAVEWYREKFKFNRSTPGALSTAELISMVPDFDGAWSPLLRIIFDDAKHIQEGAYTEEHVRAMIREINILFKKYSTPGNPTVVSDVMRALVAEINRRFGRIKQSEIDKYLKARTRDDSKDTYLDAERLDFNLNDEKSETGRRVAPSDRYDLLAPTGERKVEHPFEWKMQDELRKFREDIDEEFAKLHESAKSISFDDTISQYKQQVRAARDNADKYRIVLRAMQGVDHLNLTNQYKILMFHEMVVSPLGTLYTLWTTVSEFSTRVRAMDVHELEETLRARMGQTRAAGAALTAADLWEAVRTKRRGLDQYLHPGFLPDVNGRPRPGTPAEDRHTYTRAPLTRAAAGAPLRPDDDRIVVYAGTYGWQPIANAAGAPEEHLMWGRLAAVAGQVSNAALAAADRKNIEEGCIRFMVDREVLLRDLVNTLFAFGSDMGDLVQVKIQDRSVIVEYSKLAELVMTTLANVKKNLERFRGVVDEKIMRRVEGGAPGAGAATGDVKRNVCSIYWLEEQLVERLLKDSREESKGVVGMNRLNDIIQRTFKRLAGEWTVLARLVPIAGAAPGTFRFDAPFAAGAGAGELEKRRAKHEQSLLRDSYDQPISELTFWRNRPTWEDNGGNLVKTDQFQRRPAVPHDSKRWLWSTIPHIDDLKYDEGDSKLYKTLDDTLQSSARQIVRLANAMWQAGAGAHNAWLLANIGDDPAPALVGVAPARPVDGDLPTPQFWRDNMKGSGPWAGLRAAPSIFRMETKGAAAEDWSDVNTDSHIAFLSDSFDENVPDALKEHAKKMKELVSQYNASFKQRDAIRQNTLRAPISQRVEWYMDPEDPDYGAYLLHQIYRAGDARFGQVFEGGLLVRLNELLARYLHSGWDQIGRKMYAGVINGFATGTHSQQVLKGRAINDIVPNSNASGFLGLPPAHSTVFASLARFARNVTMATKRRSSDPEFRVDTLMDVPIHMKEAYRSNLPEFSKLFRMVLRKTELIRLVAMQVSTVRQLGILDKPGVMRVPGGNSPLAGTAAGVPSHQHSLGAGPLMAILPRFNPALLGTNQWAHVPTGFVTVLDGVAAAPSAEWVRGSEHFSNVGAPVDAGVAAAIADPTAATRIRAYLNGMCHGRSEAFAYDGFMPMEELDADASRQWHTALLDDISGMATSLEKCASAVHKEMGDEPRFFELRDGFISEYTNTHKKTPIMLVSEMQVAIRNRHTPRPAGDMNDDEWNQEARTGYARTNFMLPFYRNGEQPFKMQYGTRMFLNRPDVKPVIEYMPGMAALLDRYNGISTGDRRVDKAEFESAAAGHIGLIRYLVDLRHYRGVLDTHSGGYAPGAPRTAGEALFDSPLNIAAVDARNPDGLLPRALVIWPAQFRPYAMRNTLDNILGITESSDQDASVADIVRSVVDKDKVQLDDRKSTRIYNFLDLNIVPIIVHAFARDYPLAYLMNYSYSADRMIQEAFMPRGRSDGSFKLIDENFVPSNTMEFFTKMLIHPYANLSDAEFYGWMQRLLTGDTDSKLDINIPRYLSDQLWNKSLLQDLYTTPATGRGRPDEAGPRVDNAQRRITDPLSESKGVGAAGFMNMSGNDVAAVLTPFTDPAVWSRGIINEAGAVAVIDRLAVVLGLVAAGAQAPAALRENKSLIARIIAASPVVMELMFATPVGVGAAATGLASAPGSIAPVAFVAAGFVAALRNNIPQASLTGLAGVANIVSRAADAPAVRDLIAVFAGAPGARLAFNVFKTAISWMLAQTIVERSRAENKESTTLENNGSLQYYEETEDGKAGLKTVVTVGPAGDRAKQNPQTLRSDLSLLGRARFDSTLVRNLWYVTSLQMAMQVLMRRAVTYTESPIADGEKVLDRNIIEYRGNQRYRSSDFHA